MSASDSDYSIDWLASDEDDYDSPKRLSPEHAEEPLVPPPASSSSLSSSLRESPTSCFHCEATQRRWRRRCDCKDGGRCGVGVGVGADSPAAPQSPAVSPLQGFTSVYTQQTLSVQSRKRTHGAARADTENELFSQKCSELQRYIQPLSSILRGLRSGRYSQRLSSFQESVAMDRIQRIMGVLQNPDTGGRFLNIILKIEEMLQSWFPHIRPNLTDDGAQPKRPKHHLHHGGASLPPPPPPPPSPLASLCSSDVDPASLGSLYSTTHLKWLHTSPICSLKTPESTLVQRASSSSTSSTSPLPARCSQEVTQDNAVSSSTDSHKTTTTPPLRRLGAEPRVGRGRPAFKISSPCLERLLQAKESIIAPRTDGGWLS